ncbi:MAG: histidine kinase [Gracilibacter sp. BRH_c7a]|nr:MAG: histidine kinase [Gracilibacter sp. BRH_c7a]
MKNKNNEERKSKKENLRQIIIWPARLMTIIWNFIKEKLEFSIRFKLSLSYIRILFGALITAGLGVVLVFGTLTIYGKVSEDYSALSQILNKNNVEDSDVRYYAKEHKATVLIYDYDQKLIIATESELDDYGYKRFISVVRTNDTIYLGINRSEIYSGIPVKVVIYSDIGEEIATLLVISRIILIIFTLVLFFAIISIAFSGRGIFQPIKEMTQTVKDISERNLNLRLNVSGSKNELKELALTFNEMMNRIEDYYNRQKQFVSDASHELRTPIAVVQGYVDMLDRWGKNDREILQESIDAIKNESENMKELIEKLLFLARHDKDTFVFQKEEFSLSEMLLEIAKETHIIDSSHKINIDISKEVPIYADRNRIKQAIRILIDNALKYTPADGEILISLGDEGDDIAISIKDTGVGMTREELRHIFDRFYRSDQSRTKEKGGHGLGLAIAKIIILGHGGKIKVKSKVGEGSEFVILL